MYGLVALMTIHVLAKRESCGSLLALLIAFVGAVGASFGMVFLARHVTHDSSSMFGLLVGVGAGATFAVTYLVVRGALGQAPRRFGLLRVSARIDRAAGVPVECGSCL